MIVEYGGKVKKRSIDIIRIIVIIAVGAVIISGIGVINKNRELKKLQKAEENTVAVIKAAKKKYDGESKENEDVSKWQNLDAKELDVKNKPETGTYTIIIYDDHVEVLVTNLKFDNLYCQYDGEKVECSEKKVKEKIQESNKDDNHIEEEIPKEDGGGISIDGDYDNEEDDMGGTGVEDDENSNTGSILDKDEDINNGETISGEKENINGGGTSDVPKADINR